MFRRSETRRYITAVGCAAALALGMAATAHAQQRQLFQWTGNVNQEVRLTLNGSRLSTTPMGPREPGRGTSNVMSSMPQRDGEVRVTSTGRGTVDVIQQPSARNGFITVIRVRNPNAGVGGFRVNAFWQPAAGGVLGPPFRPGFGANRVALRWSGNVDDQLEITLRRNGVSHRTIRGRPPFGVSSGVTGALPGARGLTIIQTQGRGSIDIIQQPTLRNGFTARIRVRDPQPGFGRYSFNAIWR